MIRIDFMEKLREKIIGNTEFSQLLVTPSI